MKASVVSAIGGGFAVQELELAQPLDREVLIDVKASGLCHSDLTLATAGIGQPPPVVLGHEVAGVVVAKGAHVTGINLGDHVVASLIQFCGRCTQCLSGHTYSCLHPEATLRGQDEPARLHARDGSVVNQGYGLGGLPPTAQVAHQQAQYLVRTLQRRLGGKEAPDFVYRDFGALVSLADYDAFGSLGKFGIFKGGIIRGQLAQFSHVMLYRSHQARIHGFWRGGLLWLVDRLNARLRAPIRLD
ncbi:MULTISPECIES: alcohol dehydrogenase catalytic domain-containing protein [Stenotrophomonas]|uniref:alcohol dehydrogenase catalytic domain-containing protein n=1 Tax=Stenotrophomonas TaxID=40323 RepID=UPI000770372E|nr:MULTISPECIES: alcohol dehydrogenase catalytic domain-containing protein [Stenotrophomonas]AMJ55322.1 hypothetical protein AXG53_00745 [Stenotrophomonas sp. KCTC 12332]